MILWVFSGVPYATDLDILYTGELYRVSSGATVEEGALSDEATGIFLGPQGLADNRIGISDSLFFGTLVL